MAAAIALLARASAPAQASSFDRWLRNPYPHNRDIASWFDDVALGTMVIIF